MFNESVGFDLRLFVGVEELRVMLERGDVVVLDVRRFDEYVRAHIPGSSWLYFWDLTLYERGLPSTPKPRDEVARVFGRSGVGDGDYVVLVYDRSSLLYAAYTAWFLEYVGHEEYSLLKGGFEAWLSAGLPVERGIFKPREKRLTVKPSSVRATLDEVVEAVMGRGNLLILDVRTRDEHVGAIATTHRAGRIPGSIPLDPELPLKALNGDANALERIKSIVGSSENIVLYCTSGERASLAWLVLRRILGVKNAKLFPEGFLEYSKRENLPVEIGDSKVSGSTREAIRIDKNKLCEEGLANPLKKILEAINNLEKGGSMVIELNDADWILTLRKLAESRGFNVKVLGVTEDGFTRLLLEKTGLR